MKKFILSSLLFLLVGSFGNAIVAAAHAQTASPTGALPVIDPAQSLEGLKAKLLDLQAQAAAEALSPAPSGAASGNASISAQNLAAVSAGLRALTISLGQLSQIIASNPAVLTDSNRLALRSALGGVSATLLAMDQTLATDVPRAPVAASQAAPIAAQKAPAPLISPTNQTAAAPAPTATQAAGVVANQVPAGSPSAFAAGSNAALGTAQVAGRVPLSSGWIVTIGVVILLLIVMLVSRLRTSKKGIRAVTYPANLPASPVSNVPTSVPPAQKPIPMESVHRYDSPRPPLSSMTPPITPPLTPDDF